MASVHKKYQQLEQSRQQLMKRLDQYSQEQLEQQPADGGWSVVQVMGHLEVAENAATQYMSKKLQYKEGLQKDSFGTWWRFTLLKIFFALPLKFKAPAIATPDLGENSLPEMKEKWAETRGKLGALIEQIPEELHSTNIFKHPAAGKINLYQAIDFMQIHFDRHLAQIERVLKG